MEYHSPIITETTTTQGYHSPIITETTTTQGY